MRKKLLRSRSGFEKPESREEAIMQNILGASNVLEPSESNIEKILKSILYNTPYTKEAEFEIEKILLAIKNNGTYDGECESRDLKILFAILNDLDYTEEAESRIEELFIEWLHQRSSIKVLEGIPPLTFTSLGQPLINYLIEGNTVQSDTPAPDNPIMPEGCGNLEATGEHAGQYKIPISSANTSTPVYLGEVETTRQIKKLVLTGQEDWSISNTFIGSFYLKITDAIIQGIGACDRAINAADLTNYSYGKVFFETHSRGNYINMWLFNENITKGDFITYLQQQYAAGTPLTVWYVLSSATTGIVNEPLMKIGDYADTVSKEQAGVEIPTASGSNTLDVDTTVKPSSIYIEYK